MTLCLVCRTWQRNVLCEDCVTRFAQPRPRCPRCALPQPTARLCDECGLAPPPLDACLTAVDYDYPWSQAIARLKFGGDAALAHSLALLMRHAPWVEPTLEAADRVLPIPLSQQRLQERGFNQTRELARHLAADKCDLTCLQRVEGDTVHQIGASRAQRLEQVAHSFWLTPEALTTLRGQRVVLLDDVMTTGATLHAAAHLLRRAGVAHVAALVFARTPKPPRSIHDNADHVQHRAGPA